MVECNSYETPNRYPNVSVPLSNQQQFRLNKINEIKDYFVAEIKERELMSKILSKYIASFDYFDKLLIFLSVTTSSPDLLIVLLDHLLKAKKELKNLKKQETQNIFTEMNLIKLFST